ncbi:MAG TPA: HAD hydrolase-like protein [Candidatus Nanoarchaeia archaeon]|nr:HAD hydrolase-like protein [Candidatus Nanoarchaeia archaeon]
MHILFDWDGTIAKKEVAEEASLRRCKTLDVAVTPEQMREMQKTHAHYDINKAALTKYTGVKDPKILTTLMTNLFQLHYLGVVNEWKERIFYEGMLDALKKLRVKKNTLSIVTTLRQDIVDLALEAIGYRNLFAKIYGNTPDLAYTKEQLARQAVNDCGEAHYLVGDREDDLKAGRAVGAKTAFASWGHGELNDENLADTILVTPEDILTFK